MAIYVQGIRTDTGGAGGAGISGTPVDNQLSVWVDDSTIEGDADLTWDGSDLSIDGTITNSSGNLNIDPTSYAIIGSGTSVLGILGTGDDLYVSRYLEVDGVSWFNSTLNCNNGFDLEGGVANFKSQVRFAVDQDIQFGALKTYFKWVTVGVGTPQFRIGMSDANKAVSIIEHTDLALGDYSSTVPALLIHGADHTQYGKSSHDATDFVIETTSGTVKIDSGITHKTTVVNASTYALLITDYILFVDYTATGTVAFTLPTAQSLAGRTIVIKDSGYNASSFNITIGTGGAELVENGATLVLSTDGQTVKLTSDGTDWHIVG